MPDSTTLPHLVRFGTFEVDLRSGELRKNGQKIKIQEQPFHVLAMLLEHPGEIVTREELQKALWSTDTFVDFEHGLNKAINKIREALGDSADNPRFVETLARRGYRFIAPVEALTPVPSPAGRGEREIQGVQPSPSGRGWPAGPGDGAVAPVSSPAISAARTPPLQKEWIVALAAGVVVLSLAALFALNVAGVRDRVLTGVGAQGLVPLPRIQSIAVLPLENLSHDPEQEYFADGMTDALITSLGKISALRVISRTSMMRYKGTTKPLPEIARELNVDAIVEGTVQRSGDRVRITANLLHAPTDRHLWAESYERDLRDILVLQSEVARAIANGIQITVTPQEHARLARSRPVDPEAHELYLKGRYFWNKRTEEAVKKSLDYFQQAIRKDPGSALAYAGLADAYRILGTFEFLPPKEVYPRAKVAALKALEIDPSLAEAHASLGMIKIEYDWDASGSEEEYKRAIQLNPNYATAHQWYGEYLTLVGRHDESLVENERARQLDPLSLITNNVVAAVLYYARRYEEAIRQYQKTLEIDPNFVLAHFYLADAYAQTRCFPEAIAEAQKAVSLSGAAPLFAASLARVYAAAGNRAAARRLLKNVSSRTYVPKYHVAMAHIAMGEHEQAFAWLEKAVEDRSPQLVWLKVEPKVDALRSDPRFQDLLRRMNFPP